MERDLKNPQHLWAYLRSFNIRTTLWPSKGSNSFSDLRKKLDSGAFVLEERGETLVLVYTRHDKTPHCSFVDLELVIKIK